MDVLLLGLRRGCCTEALRIFEAADRSLTHLSRSMRDS